MCGISILDYTLYLIYNPVESYYKIELTVTRKPNMFEQIGTDAAISEVFSDFFNKRIHAISYKIEHGKN